MKTIAGSSKGYQELVREVLWDYVQRNSGQYKSSFNRSHIVSVIAAEAIQEQTCVLSKEVIRPGDEFYTGVTIDGLFVPLSKAAVD